MIRSILCVTHCAHDLGAVEAAYTKYLDYCVVERGRISSALADFWQAPTVAGRNFLLLQPASEEPVYLRFVQADPNADHAAMKSYGWNATEILVKETDAIAARLSNSPFQIIGEPRGLSSNENIHAMQVIGPAGELLYLTSIPENESAFNLGSAKTDVDRVFIVVSGGSDLDAMRNFYSNTLKMPVTAPMNVRISVLSKAYGMEAEHLHSLAIARLPERFLIELDEYPANAVERPQLTGELPPGMALVTFSVDSLDGFAPVRLEEKPYNGRQAAMLKGAAGEWIELVA